MARDPFQISIAVPFDEAIAAAKRRGVVLPEVYYGELPAKMRSRAFTVSGLTSLDQIQRVMDSLEAATQNGQTFRDWKKAVLADVPDLGKLPADRLDNVFRTAIQTHYNIGRWEQLERNRERRPYLMYDAINDGRTRPAHRAMDNHIAPIDDPIWNRWYPPNGFRCRCSVIALTEAQAKARGYGTKPTPTVDPDQGWDYHPGLSHDEALRKLAKAKLAKAHARLAAKRAEDIAALQAEARTLLKAIAIESGEAELARSIAKAQAAAGAWKLQEAAAGNLGKWYAQAAKKGASPAEIDAAAAALKAKYSAKVAVANYKKASLAGKPLKPHWQAAVDALDDPEKLALQAEIAQAKAAASALARATTAGTGRDARELVDEVTRLRVDGWQQVGPQRGSNPGGLFEAPDGAQWYIKFPADQAKVHNEVLAGRLYRLAGVDVPELAIAERDGRIGVASRIVPNLTSDASRLRTGKVPGVAEGFGADAWLANWDVVGLNYDNLLVDAAGRAWRVDTGGALLFRAQGATKGTAFGRQVGEIDTLRDAAKNSQAASVFGTLTEPEIKASLARIIAIDEDTIRQTVVAHGGGTLAEREALADLLIARRADIVRRFPDLPEKVAEAIGYAEDAARSEIRARLGELSDDIVTAIKGIASRAGRGEALLAKDVERVAAAASRWQALLETHGRLLDAETYRTLTAHHAPWLATLQGVVESGVGAVARWEAAGQWTRYTGGITLARGAVRPNFSPGLFGGLRHYTDAEAKGILERAFGSSAARLNVPRHPGAEALDSLPMSYRRAITAWTGSYYGQVTGPVLSGRARGEIVDYVDLLDGSLRAAPVKYRGEIARGLRFSQFLDQTWVERHRAAKRSGDVLEMALPSSWKRGDRPAWGDDVVLHIRASRQGVYVNPISLHHGTGEDEVMMPRFQYRVDQYEKRGNTHHFWLEEVDS